MTEYFFINNRFHMLSYSENKDKLILSCIFAFSFYICRKSSYYFFCITKWSTLNQFIAGRNKYKDK